MIELRRLLRALGPALLEDTDEGDVRDIPARVELLDGQRLLTADRLYLGGPEAAAALSGVRAEPGCVIVLTDSAAARPPACCRLLRVSCSLPRLFNTLSALMAEAPAAPAGTDLFLQCWERIMERTLTGTEEIRSALERTPHPPASFVQIGVVGFDAGCGPDCRRQALDQLRRMFPDCNLTLYQKDVLLMLSSKERCFRRSIPGEPELEALLRRCRGSFCLSNNTRNLSALPILYRLAVQTLVLARQVCSDPDRRIFTYEEFSIYTVIDLCAQRFMELFHSDDIIYLIHPAVIHLTRYDRKHRSDLRDVLYYYLRNDRNLVKTAGDLYMHRNTVVNKVNRILELLELDLEDGGLRQRLMFSCQIIRYYENVMHLNLKL